MCGFYKKSAVLLGFRLAARRCFVLSEKVAVVVILLNILSHFLYGSIECPFRRLIGLAAGGVGDFSKGYRLYGPVLDLSTYQRSLLCSPAGVAEAQCLATVRCSR